MATDNAPLHQSVRRQLAENAKSWNGLHTVQTCRQGDDAKSALTTEASP
jgi:hypothetical protein